MLKTIVLGATQGLTEWLPVSSSGFLILIQTKLWPQAPLSQMIESALFLHGGTLLAALVYFRTDIKKIIAKEKKVLYALIVSTLISGGLGFLLLQGLKRIEQQITLTGQIVTGLVGIFLVITGLLQIITDRQDDKVMEAVSLKEAVMLGLVQAVAVLPGFSRSGLTVGLLLNLGFKKVDALKLSFLAGLPIIFAGNIILNLRRLTEIGFDWGIIISFVVGLITIRFLFKLAERINFGYFVTFFGLITFLSVFVI